MGAKVDELRQVVQEQAESVAKLTQQTSAAFDELRRDLNATQKANADQITQLTAFVAEVAAALKRTTLA